MGGAARYNYTGFQAKGIGMFTDGFAIIDKLEFKQNESDKQRAY